MVDAKVDGKGAPHEAWIVDAGKAMASVWHMAALAGHMARRVGALAPFSVGVFKQSAVESCAVFMELMAAYAKLAAHEGASGREAVVDDPPGREIGHKWRSKTLIMTYVAIGARYALPS